MTIGSRIKSARLRQGITQADLAKAAKVSTQAVSQWEREKTVPDYGRLNMVANVLNADTHWLLEGGSSEPPAANAKEDTHAIPIIKNISDSVYFASISVKNPERDSLLHEESVIPTKKLLGRGFAFAVDDSSKQDGFQIGDLCLFSSHEDLKNGDMVVATTMTPGRWSGVIFGCARWSGDHLAITKNGDAEPSLVMADSIKELSETRQLGLIIGILVEHRRLYR